MREIKFRAWDKVAEDMVWFDLPSIAKGLYLFEPTNDRAFEIMQYTGLKDKNGKEIYEGDIVHDMWFTDSKCVVNEWWYIHKMVDIDKMNSPMNHVEVIGNIYEHSHSELLEAQKEGM